jgi:peptide/nickel transport system ATP-binding protein
MTDLPLLQVKELRTYFFTDAGVVRAVDGVSFEVSSGEILGIVGESGCGKTVTALSILRLVPDPPGRIVGGQILVDGQDLLTLGEEEICRVRGRTIAMVFQEPMTSLNPVFTIGEQIADVIRLHQGLSKVDAWRRAVDMLAMVGIPDPGRRARHYPHQLSGGMRQRAMIAMALSCGPKLLIADEPTTALDVTIQAQILELLLKLKEELGMAVILITHDLRVIAGTAQRVAVMYAGMIVEEAPVKELFRNPLHPYTQALIESIPRLEADPHRKRPLRTIPGVVPDLLNAPSGCRFAPRCGEAVPECHQAVPALREVVPGHRVRCIRR